ncbi:hypothetical protein ACJX0J_024009, partial [Zea mays]
NNSYSSSSNNNNNNKHFFISWQPIAIYKHVLNKRKKNTHSDLKRDISLKWHLCVFVLRENTNQMTRILYWNLLGNNSNKLQNGKPFKKMTSFFLVEGIYQIFFLESINLF